MKLGVIISVILGLVGIAGCRPVDRSQTKVSSLPTADKAIIYVATDGNDKLDT